MEVIGGKKCGISIQMIYRCLKGHSLTVAVNYATRIYSQCYWNTLSKLLYCLYGKLCTRFPFANMSSPSPLCYMAERPANTNSFPSFKYQDVLLDESRGEILTPARRMEAPVCGCCDSKWKRDKIVFSFFHDECLTNNAFFG